MPSGNSKWTRKRCELDSGTEPPGDVQLFHSTRDYRQLPTNDSAGKKTLANERKAKHLRERTNRTYIATATARRSLSKPDQDEFVVAPLDLGVSLRLHNSTAVQGSAGRLGMFTGLAISPRAGHSDEPTLVHVSAITVRQQPASDKARASSFGLLAFSDLAR